MSAAVLAVISILMSVAAQFALKAGMKAARDRGLLDAGLSPASLPQILSEPAIVGGFVLYGLGALLWLAVLARWDVSKAYPLVGLGFIVTAAVGHLLGEQLTPLRLAGIVLICAGVVAVARS
jgi:multidrug transporter EmrE-like cation transporter